MTIENQHRRVASALAAATIALAAAGASHAGAVGGPEYGIVRLSEAPSGDPQRVLWSPARRPLPLESLEQVRGATGPALSTGPARFEALLPLGRPDELVGRAG